jgi:hypothetical protein
VGVEDFADGGWWERDADFARRGTEVVLNSTLASLETAPVRAPAGGVMRAAEVRQGAPAPDRKECVESFCRRGCWSRRRALSNTPEKMLRNQERAQWDGMGSGCSGSAAPLPDVVKIEEEPGGAAPQAAPLVLVCAW